MPSHIILNKDEVSSVRYALNVLKKHMVSKDKAEFISPSLLPLCREQSSHIKTLEAVLMRADVKVVNNE